jgi:hypothetical protein
MKKQIYGLSAILMALIFASGCNSANAATQNDNTPSPSLKIEVGKVSNTTGEKFEVNVEQMLSDALQEKLLKEHMLFFTQSEGPKLIINCNIIQYDAGNAAKRALLPGWGGTSLTTQCDLLDSNNVVGSINARETVKIGAFGGVGAWKKIFAKVANIVVKDIKSNTVNGKYAQVPVENTASVSDSQVPAKKISDSAPAETATGQTGSKEKDDIARLDKLKSMKERGLITQQEYDRKKKEIVDAM